MNLLCPCGRPVGIDVQGRPRKTYCSAVCNYAGLQHRTLPARLGKQRKLAITLDPLTKVEAFKRGKEVGRSMGYVAGQQDARRWLTGGVVQQKDVT